MKGSMKVDVQKTCDKCGSRTLVVDLSRQLLSNPPKYRCHCTTCDNEEYIEGYSISYKQPE